MCMLVYVCVCEYLIHGIFGVCVHTHSLTMLSSTSLVFSFMIHVTTHTRSTQISIIMTLRTAYNNGCILPTRAYCACDAPGGPPARNEYLNRSSVHIHFIGEQRQQQPARKELDLCAIVNRTSTSSQHRHTCILCRQSAVSEGGKRALERTKRTVTTRTTRLRRTCWWKSVGRLVGWQQQHDELLVVTARWCALGNWTELLYSRTHSHAHSRYSSLAGSKSEK